MGLEHDVRRAYDEYMELRGKMVRILSHMVKKAIQDRKDKVKVLMNAYKLIGNIEVPIKYKQHYVKAFLVKLDEGTVTIEYPSLNITRIRIIVHNSIENIDFKLDSSLLEPSEIHEAVDTVKMIPKVIDLAYRIVMDKYNELRKKIDEMRKAVEKYGAEVLDEEI